MRRTDCVGCRRRWRPRRTARRCRPFCRWNFWDRRHRRRDGTGIQSKLGNLPRLEGLGMGWRRCPGIESRVLFLSWARVVAREIGSRMRAHHVHLLQVCRLFFEGVRMGSKRTENRVACNESIGGRVRHEYFEKRRTSKPRRTRVKSHREAGRSSGSAYSPPGPSRYRIAPA